MSSIEKTRLQIMSATRFAKLRILIVDDSKHMRALIKTVLREFGVMNIAEAEHGAQAWTMAGEYYPDIIITDWLMPTMDGIELTRRLRTDKASPNPYVPVIMITGFGSREHLFAARDAGVTEFMVKPFTAGGLYGRLSEVIDRPRPFVRTKTFFGPDRRRKDDSNYEGPERRFHERVAAEKENSKRPAWSV